MRVTQELSSKWFFNIHSNIYFIRFETLVSSAFRNLYAGPHVDKDALKSYNRNNLLYFDFPVMEERCFALLLSIIGGMIKLNESQLIRNR